MSDPEKDPLPLSGKGAQISGTAIEPSRTGHQGAEVSGLGGIRKGRRQLNGAAELLLHHVETVGKGHVFDQPAFR
jgi:hypothetical protein